MTSRQASVAKIVFEEIFKEGSQLGWMDMIQLKAVWELARASMTKHQPAPWSQVPDGLKERFLNLGMAIVTRISQLPRQ